MLCFLTNAWKKAHRRSKVDVTILTQLCKNKFEKIIGTDNKNDFSVFYCLRY